MKEILLSVALAYTPTVIPLTPELKVAIEHFQGSTMALCKKEGISEDTCIDKGREKALEMRKNVDELCEKHFPDRLVACQQEGATQGFQKITQENVYKLTLILA